MRSILVTTLSLLFSSALATAQPLLVSGTIYTSDATQPIVEAVVIEDGRFQFVGDLSDAEVFAGEDVQRLELGARIAYPGFIDGHGHFADLGKTLNILDLAAADNFGDIVAMVAAASADSEPGIVIEGRGWHQSKWNREPVYKVAGFPTHDVLSEVSPNNPVVLEHANGHTFIVNAKAMEAAGINDLTETTLKYEFHDKTGHFGLRYSQNKKTSESSEWRKEMGENWQAQAISVTYEF